MQFDASTIINIHPLLLRYSEPSLIPQPSEKYYDLCTMEEINEIQTTKLWKTYWISNTSSITFISQCKFLVKESKAATCPLRPPNSRCRPFGVNFALKLWLQVHKIRNENNAWLTRSIKTYRYVPNSKFRSKCLEALVTSTFWTIWDCFKFEVRSPSSGTRNLKKIILVKCSRRCNDKVENKRVITRILQSITIPLWLTVLMPTRSSSLYFRFFFENVYP